MSKLLDRELENLRGQLVSQFTVVEQMIQMAIRALKEAHPDLTVITGAIEVSTSAWVR